MSESVPFEDPVTPYKAYLVGSDQVWNLNITGDDMTYFLQSAPAEVAKYSYAASMGPYKFTDSNHQDECIELLNGFSGISVREKTSKNYLNRCTGQVKLKNDIDVHPDPVLLLDQNEWRTFGRCKQKGKYILLYMIWRQPELIQKAQELSEQMKLPVIWISDSLRHYSKIKNKRCCSPEEFVGLFANSTYVITNSFHGTAFSIVFHKSFITVSFRDGKRMERITDLLEATGLESCSIDAKSSKETGVDIHWDLVDQKIQSMVLDAKAYLRHTADLEEITNI